MKHEITFNPADHTYWCDGIQLTSVTAKIKSITPPFDRDTIAARCARREGKTVDQILDEWEAKGALARDRGTLIHSYAEDVIDGRTDHVLAAMNDRLPEFDAFDRAWAAFRERLDARVVWKERIVGDPALGVAGRADILLSVQPRGAQRMLCLCDWKSGEKFETSGKWANLLPPWSDVGDCELSKYSIQLSTYRLLLEREDPSLVFSDSYLVHLRGDGTFRIHRATDYRDRVLAWLTNMG